MLFSGQNIITKIWAGLGQEGCLRHIEPAGTRNSMMVCIIPGFMRGEVKSLRKVGCKNGSWQCILQS